MKKTLKSLAFFGFLILVHTVLSDHELDTLFMWAAWMGGMYIGGDK